ncbi:protein HOMOLOG OF MAMMALIAN LYST-INTERACTING PROTEIN 5 [Argentina anserina]|uniref:protein HOMOLOG OF MAMMALIAN LYST-INTERACTING PROTEIN 5 n=1 Tax=Argentina anserina TaxID=57926 RepID=UPI0021767642|nr:protein HOMOLOG OF MAMMALIAN LYST-INTERACTING PROTEIN 5 [Potentilla anserina]
MAGDNEPAKLLLPYLQRADELQKHEPLVAYYCRLYAMERGLKIPQNERTKTTNSLLISLMKQLEKDKKSLELGPEDNLYLEGFALNVFGKADKQDRAGRADLNTAKTFYAASIFFEIINQFGVLQPDLEQKQKYAAWKAADIRKAVKEGRKPQPGPPAGDDDLSVPSSTTSGSYDLGPSEAAATSSGPGLDPSSQFYDAVNQQPPTHTAPSQYHEKVNLERSASFQSSPQYSANIPPPSQSYPSAGYTSHDVFPQPPSHDIHRPSPSQDVRPPPPSHDLQLPPPPSHDIHLPPPTNQPNTSDYPQPYHQQPYPHEPQQPSPHDYSPHDTTNYTYPNFSNFQSYPSFTESNIPAVSSQYPSYYQGTDISYSPPSAPSTANYPSAAQHQASHRNGTVTEPAPPAPSKTYQYDSSYMPAPEKIAEAHKAARFAVGALAFDDVSVAVDHLIKSLELLTNPSAGFGK